MSAPRSLPVAGRNTAVVATIAAALLLLLLARRGSTAAMVPPAHAAVAPRSSPTAPAARARSAPDVTPPSARDDAFVRATVHAELERLRLRQTGDDATRQEVMAELLALLTDANAGAIVRELNPAELQSEFGTAALVRWLRVDARDGSAWLVSHGGPTGEQAAIIGRSLVGSPANVLTLSDALPDGPWKQAMLSGAALQAADRDPRVAIDLAQRMPSGDDRSNAFETIAYAWAVADPVAAGKWIETVTDPLLRQRLLATGAKALASSDPDLAATWLVSAVKSGAVLNDTALTIVDAWTAKDPAAAAAWVQEFPAQAPRQEAIQLVLQRWQKSNPDAANAWLSGLPDRAAVVAQLEANATENAEPKD